MKNLNKELNIKTVKNIKNSKLYIIDYKYEPNTFESKLLELEHIDKILFAEKSLEDGNNTFVYDTNALISLNNYFLKNRLKFNDICNLLKQINDCYINIDNYLISESSLVLDSRLIFLDTKNLFNNIKFVVLPNYECDASYSLSKLLIQVLRGIDCDDKDALKLAYALFQASQMENYSIDDLLYVVKQNEERVYPANFEINPEIDAEYLNEVLKEEKENKYKQKFNIEDAYENNVLNTNDTITFSKNLTNFDNNSNIFNVSDTHQVENDNSNKENINDIKSMNENIDDIFDLDDNPISDNNYEKSKKNTKDLNTKKSKKSKLPTKEELIHLAQKTALVALFGVAFPFCLVCILVLR